MAVIKNGFIAFLALMEIVDMAIGAAIIYFGVTIYQKFKDVDTTSNVSAAAFYYFGIGRRAAARRTRWACAF